MSVHIPKDIIKPRTEGQATYIDAIQQNKIVLCDGMAGTGKTLIAVAMGLKYLKQGKAKKLVITRPAITAGDRDEDIGFLPGDLSDKMAPFTAPVIDAIKILTHMSNRDIEHMIKEDLLEIVPIAFMRGRTFRKAFIIFDEAQNSTSNEMFMFLTRIGKKCKTVIEGDTTQSDRFPHRPKEENGLGDAFNRLMNIGGIKLIHMGVDDVVRNSMLSTIIKRYY